MRPLAVTCGEPAGIGPEIIAKSYSREIHPFYVLGHPEHLRIWRPDVQIIQSPEQAVQAFEKGLPVLPIDMPEPITFGTPNPAQARGVINAIERGVNDCMKGEAAGLVTAPIHKKALQDGARFAYPGHTEFLAALAGVEDVAMMLASPLLRVVPATIHIALSAVPLKLSAGSLRRTIEITHEALIARFGIQTPCIAVAGLNPHAGEGGAMGDEELAWIRPLVEQMNREGYNLKGPLPADTMFHAAARKTYDVAVCMYHDQALIPIKTLDFDRGVNVTLGLPFFRSSPDHGTAFDIAGKGLANPSSMKAALQMASTHTKHKDESAHNGPD